VAVVPYRPRRSDLKANSILGAMERKQMSDEIWKNHDDELRQQSEAKFAELRGFAIAIGDEKRGESKPASKIDYKRLAELLGELRMSRQDFSDCVDRYLESHRLLAVASREEELRQAAELADTSAHSAEVTEYRRQIAARANIASLQQTASYAGANPPNSATQPNSSWKNLCEPGTESEELG